MKIRYRKDDFNKYHHDVLSNFFCVIIFHLLCLSPKFLVDIIFDSRLLLPDKFWKFYQNKEVQIKTCPNFDQYLRNGSIEETSQNFASNIEQI